MKIFLSVILGAAIGFAIGYFGKCASGTCPLTRNPWITTVVGAVIGLAMASAK